MSSFQRGRGGSSRSGRGGDDRILDGQMQNRRLERMRGAATQQPIPRDFGFNPYSPTPVVSQSPRPVRRFPGGGNSGGDGGGAGKFAGSSRRSSAAYMAEQARRRMLEESPAMSMLFRGGDLSSSSPVSLYDTPTQQQQHSSMQSQSLLPSNRRTTSMALPTSMMDGVFDMSNIDPDLRGPTPRPLRRPIASPLSRQNRPPPQQQEQISGEDAIEMRRQMRMRGRGDLPVMDRSFQFQLPPDASVARSAASSSMYDDSRSQLYYLDNQGYMDDTPSNHLQARAAMSRARQSGATDSVSIRDDAAGLGMGGAGVDQSFVDNGPDFDYYLDGDDDVGGEVGGSQALPMPSIREQERELMEEGDFQMRRPGEPRRQPSKGVSSNRTAGKRRRLSIEAEMQRYEPEQDEDEEGGGVETGDVTLKEQRAHKPQRSAMKKDARGLTLNPNGQPAMPGTYEDWKPMTEQEMKTRRRELQKTITLATGMSLHHKTMINDADIIHSIIAQGFRSVLGRAQHRTTLRANRELRAAFEKVEQNTAANFTTLSQQYTERHHLTTEYRKVAKKKNMLRREVLRMRSEAKRVFGIIDAIERVQEHEARREENEEQMLDFLDKLREASKEWT